jgi:2,4-diketo-3-deoxy-L-fuconate hydrolase
MKLANLHNRAVVVTDTGTIDLGKASNGSLPSELVAAIAAIDDVRDFCRLTMPEPDCALTAERLIQDLTMLGPPVPNPGQIFAVGLNYADHGDETGLGVPDEPMIFTKFASSICGPGDAIPLPTATCDWEVELVIVIGRGGRNIAVDRARAHIAGFCIGQDISERTSQMKGATPQFSLAKSHRGFAPIGPLLTTPEEIADPTDLAIATAIDGETVQHGRTSQMIFGIDELIAYLSRTCELRPGDLIFSGTPAGVGCSRTPPRFLTTGSVIHSSIEGLGQLRNPCMTTTSGVNCNGRHCVSAGCRPTQRRQHHLTVSAWGTT